MSFMAGFADGFIGAREKRVERETAAADDMFRLTYKSFLDRKAERKTQSEKDRKAAATAEAIARRYNQPLAPILDELRADVDVNLVLESAKNGKWSKIEQTSDGSDDLEASGGQVGQTDSVAQPMSTDPTIPPAGASVVGPAFDDPERNRAFTSSVGKIAEIEGRDPDQIAAELNPVQAATSRPSGTYSYTPNPEEKEFNSSAIQYEVMENQRKVASGEWTPEQYQEWSSTYVEPAIAAESMFDKPAEQKFPTTAFEMAAMEAAARASGVPERIAEAEEAKKIYEGIVLTEAQAKGEYGSAKRSIIKNEDGTITQGMVTSERGPDGSVTTRNMSLPGSPEIDPKSVFTYDEPLETLDAAILDGLKSKEVIDYKSKVNKVTTGIRIADDLTGMVEQDPQILARVTGGVASKVNNVMKELAAGADLFTRSGDPNRVIGDENMVREMESRVARLESGPIRDRAVADAVFKAKTLLFIYRMGAVEGQEGRALTEADVVRLEAMLGGSTDEKAYLQIITEYSQTNIRDLGVEADNLDQFNIPHRNYKDLTGGYSPYENAIPRVEEVVDRDPKTKAAYDKLMNRSFDDPSQEFLQREQERVQGAQPQSQGGLPQPKSQQEYQQLPSGSSYMDPEGNVRRKP